MLDFGSHTNREGHDFQSFHPSLDESSGFETLSYALSIHGIGLPMRRLRRVEHDLRRRVCRTTAELHRRLPGLLQAQRPSDPVRLFCAGILDRRRAGIAHPTSELGLMLQRPRNITVFVASRYSYLFGEASKEGAPYLEKRHRDGNRLHRRQDGRPQYGHHAV